MTQSGHPGSFSRDPCHRILTRCNLASNNVDVAAQIIDLIGERERKTDVTDSVLNALNLGLFFDQMFVVV